MFSERAGVVNIALEGMMLVGAFAAAVATFAFHSPWIGSLCGMGAGVVGSNAAQIAVMAVEECADSLPTVSLH